MNMNRRHFLKTCSVVSVGFMGLSQFACAPLLRRPAGELSGVGYGPLQPDPKGLLDLPAGFSYRIISRVGDAMDDGFLVPGAPDGMATFPGPEGLTILIRNHELKPDGAGPFGDRWQLFKKIDPAKMYDAGRGKTPSCGGTTTVVYDTRRQRVVRQYLSLAGTVRNCAGGPTPWNSWISCEETVYRAGDRDGYRFEKDHGYNFEVPAAAEIGLVDPLPLTAMGRFYHEAVAVDPHSGIVYQTEDRSDGLIYRFIPYHPGKLAQGGRLQALVIREGIRDTRNWQASPEQVPGGVAFAVDWMDLADVTNPEDDLRYRGYQAGAARFARGEGMWYGNNEVYWACTNGGRKKLGQIWRYIPGPHEGTPEEKHHPGTLELFVEPNDAELVQNADNLTVAPWGDLVVCEDRSGAVVRLCGVTPQGRLYTLANHHRRSEFAGVCFSPDGSTLFVNIQGEGVTLAITGPWLRDKAAPRASIPGAKPLQRNRG